MYGVGRGWVSQNSLALSSHVAGVGLRRAVLNSADSLAILVSSLPVELHEQKVGAMAA